jgi:NADH dehydrogenase
MIGDQIERLRMAEIPRLNSVVVVGAGFGGLEAAKALAESDVRVTIVDRKNHHCFQPLLYQVATASLSPADIAWPIRSILADQENVNVIMAEVTGIDSASKSLNPRKNSARFREG